MGQSGEPGWQALGGLEAMLVDLQGFALRVQRRGRHPEPGSRTRRTGDAASGFGQSRHNQVGLLVDSRVVDVPMAYNPIVVTPPSWNIFCVNGLQNALRFSDAVGGEDSGIPYERVTEGRSWHSTTAALAWLPGVCPPLPQRGRCPPAGATDSARLWPPVRSATPAS